MHLYFIIHFKYIKQQIQLFPAWEYRTVRYTFFIISSWCWIIWDCHPKGNREGSIAVLPQPKSPVWPEFFYCPYPLFPAAWHSAFTWSVSRKSGYLQLFCLILRHVFRCLCLIQSLRSLLRSPLFMGARHIDIIRSAPKRPVLVLLLHLR